MDERTKLISFLKDNDICSVFHYIPLHTSPAGKKFGRFNGGCAASSCWVDLGTGYDDYNGPLTKGAEIYTTKYNPVLFTIEEKQKEEKRKLILENSINRTFFSIFCEPVNYKKKLRHISIAYTG